MAELTINAEDVRNALNEFAASYEPGNAERVEVGRVVSASDGIARVEGLPSVMANELLRFEDGTLGHLMSLLSHCGCVPSTEPTETCNSG